MKTITVFTIILLACLLSACCEWKMMFPPRKPQCGPGQHPMRIVCKTCNETGFLESPCPGCRGKGFMYIKKNYGYTTYLEPTTCYDCCGGGKKLHDYCGGHGWTWQCVINP